MFGVAIRRAATTNSIGLFAASSTISAVPRVFPQAINRIQRASLSTQKDSSQIGTSLPTLEIDAFKRSAAFKRPTSPHLFIYQPQLTWGLSLFHRVTGGILGVGTLFEDMRVTPVRIKFRLDRIIWNRFMSLYGGAIWYLVAPFTSAAAAAYITAFPWIVKFVAKSAISFPMAYHTFNGFRHLLWDTANKYSFSLPGVYSTGYAVIGATFVVGLGYALY
ncbi:hypothetical protein CcCBS67573_g10305 [Chytriomyces confervae]|uniref:Uncharacterized protein n=1 Tax=Chytriomyces confervae TaxID=246404 RepID=A0A507D5K2_9FUNG|nr:hypothetical protein CcCBS67573_g10305 [Chytriomyces confervae]